MPKRARFDRHRADDKTTINAIPYVLITGCICVDKSEQHESVSNTQKIPRLVKKKFGKEFSKAQLDQVYRRNKFNIKKIAVDSTTIPSKKNMIRSIMMEMKRLQAQKHMLLSC